MNTSRRPIRSGTATSLATSASALVALVAMAAMMSSLPGVEARAAANEIVAVPSQTSTVRAVAAAVAAAARELVGAERLTAALPADHFAGDLAVPPSVQFNGLETNHLVLSRPIAERFIDLPPPAC